MDPKAELLEIVSPYIYALNSPISFIDKDGELPIFIGGRVSSDDERHSRKYWDAQLLATIAGSGIPNPGNTRMFVDGDRGIRGVKDGSYRDSGDVMHYSQISNDSFNSEDRINAGRSVARQHFKSILAQLAKDPKTGKITEKIQIYTHIRGGAFGVGYTEALLQLIKENADLFEDAVNEIDFVFNMAYLKQLMPVLYKSLYLIIRRNKNKWVKEGFIANSYQFCYPPPLRQAGVIANEALVIRRGLNTPERFMNRKVLAKGIYAWKVFTFLNKNRFKITIIDFYITYKKHDYRFSNGGGSETVFEYDCDKGVWKLSSSETKGN